MLCSALLCSALLCSDCSLKSRWGVPLGGPLGGSPACLRGLWPLANSAALVPGGGGGGRVPSKLTKLFWAKDAFPTAGKASPPPSPGDEALADRDRARHRDGAHIGSAKEGSKHRVTNMPSATYSLKVDGRCSLCPLSPSHSSPLDPALLVCSDGPIREASRRPHGGYDAEQVLPPPFLLSIWYSTMQFPPPPHN